MNKILNLLLVTLVLVLTSCRDEPEIPDHGKKGNPEKETAGTYVGTWSKALRNSDDAPVEAQGSLILAATDESYVTVVTIDCASSEIGFNDKSNFSSTDCRANIINQSAQYVFYNVLNGNAFGTPFNGTVSFDGTATITFSKTIKEGRKTYTYDYTFSGTKQ
ncbi:MAG: hypothetical protein K2M71_09695 [Duncaniella sp.]|nr:hypothetical protein [Bacteroides sp.]MDE5827232.1 hypothetical protein [Duncaniella sp.]MDE6823521.1 hypothetical protein [Duncaniella sp.]MDE7475887.1 hypothetical protein [Duncaniella sp.]